MKPKILKIEKDGLKKSKRSRASCGWVLFTKELAEQVMGLNTKNNRPLSGRHLKFYAKDMVENNWKQNGDTVKFDWNGRMIDGQHRMLCIIDSGEPQEFLVVFDLDPEIFPYIDNNYGRTTAVAAGSMDIPNPGRVAAALAVVSQYDSDSGIVRRTRNSDLRPASLRRILDPYPDLKDVIKDGGVNPKPSVVKASHLDACLYIFNREDPKLAHEYIEYLRGGFFETVRRPWFDVRELFIAIRQDNRVPKDNVALAILITGWNAVRLGNELKDGIWNPEEDPFPKAA